MPSYTRADIARTIDHSVLQPQLTLGEVRAAIALGRDAGAASCCVRPADVPLAAELLRGSPTLVCTVVGFPHGSSTTATKLAECAEALAAGAVEIDMVVNIGRLRSDTAEDDAYVAAEVRAIVAACAAAPPPARSVKVILENAYLSDAQKARGCAIVEAAGAAFAKTSTGFAVVAGDKAQGATIADLQLMRRTCGPRVAIKAAGGVRTLDALLGVLAVGATRVGATATKAILDDFDARTRDTGGVLVVADAPAGGAGGVGGGY